MQNLQIRRCQSFFFKIISHEILTFQNKNKRVWGYGHLIQREGKISSNRLSLKAHMKSQISDSNSTVDCKQDFSSGSKKPTVIKWGSRVLSWVY